MSQWKFWKSFLAYGISIFLTHHLLIKPISKRLYIASNEPALDCFALLYDAQAVSWSGRVTISGCRHCRPSLS